MNKKPNHLYKLIIILLLFLSSCTNSNGNTKDREYNFEVVSFSDYYGKLCDLSKIWDQEAYLYHVSVSIHKDIPDDKDLSMVAGFKSPNKTTESFGVFIYADGTMNQKIIPHNIEVIQNTPIVFTEDILDSNEILNNIQNEEIYKSLLTSEISELILEWSSEDNSILIWRLSYNLGTNDTTHIHFNAKTGEVISTVVY